MLEKLAERIATLEESATLQMAAMVRELKSRGEDIVDLTLGEPDFDTPLHIKEAAKQAIDKGITKYTPVAGFLDLRKSIAQKLDRDNQLTYTPEQIVCSTGAKQSIANVVLSLINPGDEVIIPAPYWVSYSAITHLAEGKVITIASTVEQDYKITPAQLEAVITPKSKLFIFSSPCNPTGAVYTKEELEALAVVFRKYPNIIILADEIYEYINFTGVHASIASLEGMYDRTVIVNGFSKGFAMTGWRLGYIAAPLWIAQACTKMQGQFTSGTCSITQMAGEAAMLGDMTPTTDMCAHYKRRRDLGYAQLKNIPGLKVNLPTGAFYFFTDISSFFGKKNGDISISNAHDMSMYLLSDAKVSTVSGEAFGDGNCIRFSYATSDDKLLLAMDRIAISLAKLK
jgi:aspartate aminotransferase